LAAANVAIGKPSKHTAPPRAVYKEAMPVFEPVTPIAATVAVSNIASDRRPPTTETSPLTTRSQRSLGMRHPSMIDLSPRTRTVNGMKHYKLP
jgi:hypothetical protein